jgi:hypothetical protein
MRRSERSLRSVASADIGVTKPELGNEGGFSNLVIRAPALTPATPSCGTAYPPDFQSAVSIGDEELAQVDQGKGLKLSTECSVIGSWLLVTGESETESRGQVRTQTEFGHEEAQGGSGASRSGPVDNGGGRTTVITTRRGNSSAQVLCRSRGGRKFLASGGS